MRITLQLDTSDSRAQALLDFVRTLDFVEFESESELTEPQKQAIRQGLDSLEVGKGRPHADVMAEPKKKFPHLFGHA